MTSHSDMNDSEKNDYAEWFEQVRSEYGEQFQAMPLPEGLPEYVHQLVTRGDEEALKFMLKLAWQMGAQMGFAAGSQQKSRASAMHVGPHRAQA